MHCNVKGWNPDGILWRALATRPHSGLNDSERLSGPAKGQTHLGRKAHSPAHDGFESDGSDDFPPRLSSFEVNQVLDVEVVEPIEDAAGVERSAPLSSGVIACLSPCHITGKSSRGRPESWTSLPRPPARRGRPLQVSPLATYRRRRAERRTGLGVRQLTTPACERKARPSRHANLGCIAFA